MATALYPRYYTKAQIFAAARELRERLWAPLGITQGGIVAIADSPLTSRVSFASISGARGETFLFEDHALIRGYSLRDFWPSTSPTTSSRDALSVQGSADDAAAGAESRFLQVFPGARRVAPKASHLDDLRTLLGKSAFRYVSVSAHGLFKPDDKRKPGEDRIVREALWAQTKLSFGGRSASALELLTLPLERVEVVLLGACQSGQGPEGTEGVTTIRRAMHLAGARAVVSSIGLVNKNAERLLAGLFWEEIDKGTPSALALSRAQRRRIADLRTNDRSEPWYSPSQWALLEITTSLPPK